MIAWIIAHVEALQHSGVDDMAAAGQEDVVNRKIVGSRAFHEATDGGAGIVRVGVFQIKRVVAIQQCLQGTGREIRIEVTGNCQERSFLLLHHLLLEHDDLLEFRVGQQVVEMGVGEGEYFSGFPVFQHCPGCNAGIDAGRIAGALDIRGIGEPEGSAMEKFESVFLIENAVALISEMDAVPVAAAAVEGIRLHELVHVRQHLFREFLHADQVRVVPADHFFN